MILNVLYVPMILFGALFWLSANGYSISERSFTCKGVGVDKYSSPFPTISTFPVFLHKIIGFNLNPILKIRIRQSTPTLSTAGNMGLARISRSVASGGLLFYGIPAGVIEHNQTKS
jgi:hypothetical protein